jgi:sialate O-acetylesterase
MEEIPNTGMAVCTDRGDSLDVHPTRKQEVGERLAYWALNKTYGHHVVPSGPLYKSVSFQKNVAYVSFDYAEGMKAADGNEIVTFEVAGEDHMFYPAKAVVEGNQVKVWSDKVKEPKIVRYGWQPFTRANLVNGAGLPASTFRSDVK